MPSDVAHLRQAARNAGFLAALRQRATGSPEWAITVAFYTAVHLVEAHFARSQPAVHCRSHADRLTQVSLRLRAIEAEYWALYVASRRARYECIEVSAEEAATELEMNFEPVRTHMRRLLGIEV